MSQREAAEIVDEHIALWRNRGVEPREAWQALGHARPWAVEWWEVRGCMIRWQLAYAADRSIEKRAA